MGQALEGKVAVVTGGASGIGRAAVELFRAEGARVVVGDFNAEAGEAVAAGDPEGIAFIRCDVRREDDIAGLMDGAVERFGAIDVLFNNAGATGSPAMLEEMTGAIWDETQALILRSVALGMRYAIPALKRRGGAIVNTASVAALQAGLGPFAYSVAKAGVLHLTRVAAAELSAYGIRVNAICPGFIMTEIHTQGLNEPPQMIAARRRRLETIAPRAQPVGRTGEGWDIAQACLYLASDASRFVTGTHIVVDGGLTVGPRDSWDRALQGERAAQTAATLRELTEKG